MLVTYTVPFSQIYKLFSESVSTILVFVIFQVICYVRRYTLFPLCIKSTNYCLKIQHLEDERMKRKLSVWHQIKSHGGAPPEPLRDLCPQGMAACEVSLFFPLWRWQPYKQLQMNNLRGQKVTKMKAMEIGGLWRNNIMLLECSDEWDSLKSADIRPYIPFSVVLVSQYVFQNMWPLKWKPSPYTFPLQHNMCFIDHKAVTWIAAVVRCHCFGQPEQPHKQHGELLKQHTSCTYTFIVQIV